MSNLIESTLLVENGEHLYTAHLLPDGESRAVVVVVHGYAEHSGRYRHVLEALAKNGYAAYTLDHYGHGRSPGLRAYTRSLVRFVDDLRRYIIEVRLQNAGKQVFLLGHSMGALIALSFAVRYGSLIDGLITSGIPLDADANVSPVLIAVANILNLFAPTAALTDVASSKLVSRDVAVVEAFDQDPLNYHGKMRVGIGVAMNREAAFMRANLARLTMPYLILHGEADRMVAPSGSQRAYDLAASADKTLTFYPGLWHEILNEPEGAQVMEDVVSWLNAHTV